MNIVYKSTDQVCCRNIPQNRFEHVQDFGGPRRKTDVKSRIEPDFLMRGPEPLQTGLQRGVENRRFNQIKNTLRKRTTQITLYNFSKKGA